MSPLPQLVAADKAISYFPGWSEPEPETGYIWFDAPLEVGGVVERAFQLHGGCDVNYPDRHVVFELRVGKSPGRKRIPLMRVEWRSLQGGHTNPRRRGNPLSGLTVSDTHFHPFEPNWSETEGRMRRGNLRMAAEIAEDLQAFEDVRAFAGNTLESAT